MTCTGAENYGEVLIKYCVAGITEENYGGNRKIDKNVIYNNNKMLDGLS